MTTLQPLLAAVSQACQEIAQSAAHCPTPAQGEELARHKQDELLRLIAHYVRGQGALYAMRARRSYEGGYINDKKIRDDR